MRTLPPSVASATTTTTATAATASTTLRKRKLLKRLLLRCFSSSSKRNATTTKVPTTTSKVPLLPVVVCKPEQTLRSVREEEEEDMTSVISSSSSSSTSGHDNDNDNDNNNTYDYQWQQHQHQHQALQASVSAVSTFVSTSVSTTSVSPPPTVPPQLPQDVWREICFWVNDATTLCRLACVSKDLNQRVKDATPLVYQGLYQHRWIRSSSSSSSMDTATITAADWKKIFQKRFAYEGHVVRTMQQVVLLELEPQIVCVEMLLDHQQQHHHYHQHCSEYGRIASIAIEHDGWKRLLQQQPHDDDDDNTTTTTLSSYSSPPLDVLCALANGETSYHPAIARVCNDHGKLHPRTLAKRRALLRFAAASTTFTFHCQEVITEMANVWEESLYHQMRQQQQQQQQQHVHHPNNHTITTTTTPTTQVAYEETAVLLSHALRTVPNLLQRTSSLGQLQASVSQQLDQMTRLVQQHVTYYVDKRHQPQVPSSSSSPSSSHGCDTREVLFTIHYVLSKHYHITSHLPFCATAGTASTSEQQHVLHSCSISHVLLDYYYHNQQQQQQRQRQQDDAAVVVSPNLCHPILVAIIYQAVARRMGLMSDILFCPEHCHALLRFSSSTTTLASSSLYSSKTSDLLFLDLVQIPGRIMALNECQDLIRTCKLVTEQDYSEQNRQRLFSDGTLNENYNNNSNNHNDDDMDEDLRTTFWSQPPMSIPSVVYWLAAPFFAKPRLGRTYHHHDEDEEEDQPFDYLLGQLVESSGGGGGRLISFLQDRMVFFSSIMRHCKLIP